MQMNIQQQNMPLTCDSSPTTSISIATTIMAADERDELPCQLSPVILHTTDEPSTFDLQQESLKFDDSRNLKVDAQRALGDTVLFATGVSSKQLARPKSVQDERTLVMMITEMDNEVNKEEEQHHLLKRKSEIGVLELDLPHQLTLPMTMAPIKELKRLEDQKLADEPMDTVESAEPLQSPILLSSLCHITTPSLREPTFLDFIEEKKSKQQHLIQTSTMNQLEMEKIPMDLKSTILPEAQLSPSDPKTSVSSSFTQLSPIEVSASMPSLNKAPETSENLPPIAPPPLMPRNITTGAPPPRPMKPKAKRRPPNLPSIQPDSQDSANLLPIRAIETLRLRVEQIRNLQFTPLILVDQCNHSASTASGKKNLSTCTGPTPLTSVLRLHIKIDGKEVFQSSPVPTGESCVFSDEIPLQTLPSNFRSIQLILVETIDGRITRQLGRKSLKRRDLISTTEQDICPPLYSPVPGRPHLGQQPVCEVLGQLCLDVEFDETTKELEFRVLDCTAWKRGGGSCKDAQAFASTSNKRPQSQQFDYASNPAVTTLHYQIFAQRSFSGSQTFGSTSDLNQRNSQLASPSLTKKTTKFSLSPKLSRKNRHSQPVPVYQKLHQQQKLTGSLSSGFERKRPPSLSSQPLPRPQSPPPADYGTPGAPLYLIASVIVGQTQSLMRRLRIVERRGLEPVRIDCSAISNSISSTSQEIYGNLPATAPPHHQRLTVPVTPTVNDTTLQPSLCIRVSSEPNFDESTCYGSLHIDLDPQTMLPLDKAICGPNWYSLKARSKQPITTGSICATVAVQPTSSATNVRPTEFLSSDHTTSAHIHQQSSGAAFCPTDQWKNVRRVFVVSNPIQNDLEKPDMLRLARLSCFLAEACCINSASVGEMKVRWTYNMDHLLSLPHYQPLYSQLTNGLRDDCHNISLLTLIQQLPINLEEIVPPLMKIFVHSNLLKPFFRLLCIDYMAHSNFRDANTLFRSQSMVSKSMYEMMKFVGQNYLAHSLKPLIDLIYAKRECCEIDPARLKAGDMLENNQRRLMIYVELAFSCVVESSEQCPATMREVFAELRSVVANFFPQREDIGRLAVSSFLIMRFFSAAILNPKIFGLKREAPEPDVMRTLVLISKVLQRLANCVVSEKPLTTKEEWLTPILERVSDSAHKQSMIKFLDIVSNVAPSITEPLTPPSPLSSSASPSFIEDMDSRPSTLKFGHMIERRSGSDKKRSFKNLIHQKRRYVTLTENELTWQKVKEGNDDLEPKGNFAVADIRSVAPLLESKNSFCVGTLNSEVHFQANNTIEMNEWMILIEKQQLRHMMVVGRSSRTYHQHLLKIDLEHELETVYSVLEAHLDTLCLWKQALEKRGSICFGKDSPTSLDKLILGASSAEEQELMLRALEQTIGRTIICTQQIQKMHKNRGQALKLIQANTFKSQPATPGSPLASPTALLAKSMDYQARMFSDSNPPTPTSPIAQESPQKDALNVVLVDSENYLHLRSGGACKRVRKAPSTNLFDASNKLSASVTSLGPPPKSPTA